MIAIGQREAWGQLTIIVAEAGERSRTMTTRMTVDGFCSVCSKPVQGGFEVIRNTWQGEPLTEVALTPDRNFIVCDQCDETICIRCSDRPASGLCNECFRISSVSIYDDEENKRALTPITMEQPPEIIYEEPQGSELTADQRARLVLKLIKQREVDIADFQGRIETLTDKLHEVVNEFAGYMGEIDAAIIDVMHATDLLKAGESASQFD